MHKYIFTQCGFVYLDEKKRNESLEKVKIFNKFIYFFYYHKKQNI